MATDIAPEMLGRIRRLYKSGVAANPLIRGLLEEKTYSNAQIYAIQHGKAASRALTTVITEDALPNGRLYYNIAEKTVQPLLEDVYANVADYCGEVQSIKNAAAGIGINAIRPALNTDRLHGIIWKLAEADFFADVKWVLEAPVQNFSQSVVDDSIRYNMDFQSGAGVGVTMWRTAKGAKICELCRSLAGKYKYPDVLSQVDNIFMRHDRCECTIDFDSGWKGRNPWGSQVGKITRRNQDRLDLEEFDRNRQNR